MDESGKAQPKNHAQRSRRADGRRLRPPKYEDEEDEETTAKESA